MFCVQQTEVRPIGSVTEPLVSDSRAPDLYNSRILPRSGMACVSPSHDKHVPIQLQDCNITPGSSPDPEWPVWVHPMTNTSLSSYRTVIPQLFLWLPTTTWENQPTGRVEFLRPDGNTNRSDEYDSVCNRPYLRVPKDKHNPRMKDTQLQIGYLVPLNAKQKLLQLHRPQEKHCCSCLVVEITSTWLPVSFQRRKYSSLCHVGHVKGLAIYKRGGDEELGEVCRTRLDSFSQTPSLPFPSLSMLRSMLLWPNEL